MESARSATPSGSRALSHSSFAPGGVKTTPSSVPKKNPPSPLARSSSITGTRRSTAPSERPRLRRVVRASLSSTALAAPARAHHVCRCPRCRPRPNVREREHAGPRERREVEFQTEPGLGTRCARAGPELERLDGRIAVENTAEQSRRPEIDARRARHVKLPGEARADESEIAETHERAGSRPNRDGAVERSLAFGSFGGEPLSCSSSILWRSSARRF